MRKEYGLVLRETFSETLAVVCPSFAPVRKPAMLTPVPGERVWRRVVAADRHLWVAVVPDQNREAFTIELGWSRLGRFPQLSMRPSLAQPRDAGSPEEYLCRLGALSRGRDWWWVIEEPPLGAGKQALMAYLLAQTQPVAPAVARARVLPLVQEGVAEFVHHGLPFLRANV